MIDFHCHLNHPSLFLRREFLMDERKKNWWSHLMIPWVNPNYNANTLAILNHPHATWIRAALWLHPVWIAENHDDDLCTVLLTNYVNYYTSTKNSRLCARWECGIDLYHPHHSTLTRQQKFFRLQCHIARNLNLPLIIHSRSAFEETREILKDFLDLKLYFHCRSYGIKELETILQQTDSIWFGITGLITYPKAQELRDCLKHIPDNALVLETDAPYLAPQPIRGKENTPQAIVYTYDYVARERGMTKKELISLQKINRNALYATTPSWRGV